MAIENPSIMDGFDTNQTNTSEPSDTQQTDGYSDNEVVTASNHAFMFNQWYNNLHYLKKNAFYQWSTDITYNENSFTMEDGVLYQSQTDDNTSNQPSDLDGNWEEPFVKIDNTDQTKKGNLTIGLSDTPTNVTYSGTTVTVTYDDGHGRKDGDSITGSGITSDISADEEYVNGDFTITYVSDTEFTYTATGTPTGTLSYGSATFLSGDLDVKRNISANNLIGLVLAFGNSTAPSGFLECDGSTLSRTTYSDLYAVIGTTYGIGDGITTFNIPDLRGEFIRGWDNGRGIDIGRAIATSQADEFKEHRHNQLNGDIALTGTGGGTGPFSVGGTTTDIYDEGGIETRPRNIAMMYCIKY